MCLFKSTLHIEIVVDMLKGRGPPAFNEYTLKDCF